MAKQSQLRERIKRMVRAALPDYDFDKWPVLALRPHQRDLNSGDPRPAWSISATRKSDGKFFDVYSQETMSEVVYWGLKVHSIETWDSAIWVGSAFGTENQKIEATNCLNHPNRG